MNYDENRMQSSIPHSNFNPCYVMSTHFSFVSTILKSVTHVIILYKYRKLKRNKDIVYSTKIISKCSIVDQIDKNFSGLLDLGIKL